MYKQLGQPGRPDPPMVTGGRRLPSGEIEMQTHVATVDEGPRAVRAVALGIFMGHADASSARQAAERKKVELSDCRAIEEGTPEGKHLVEKAMKRVRAAVQSSCPNVENDWEFEFGGVCAITPLKPVTEEGHRSSMCYRTQETRLYHVTPGKAQDYIEREWKKAAYDATGGLESPPAPWMSRDDQIILDLAPRWTEISRILQRSDIGAIRSRHKRIIDARNEIEDKKEKKEEHTNKMCNCLYKCLGWLMPRQSSFKTTELHAAAEAKIPCG